MTRIQVDGVGEQSSMQLLRQLGVVAGPKTPDVFRIAGYIGLRKGHQLGSVADRLIERGQSPRNARLAIEQDRRPLNDGDSVGGPVRSRHRGAPSTRQRGLRMPALYIEYGATPSAR